MSDDVLLIIAQLYCRAEQQIKAGQFGELFDRPLYHHEWRNGRRKGV